MRKICLTVIGLYLNFLHAYSQFYPVQKPTYSVRPLKFDEANLVSSYYWQNGNHSAVTGGIGTEKGMDLANGLDVKWIGYDADSNKKTLTAGLGVDYHTFASQAYVSQSGASKSWGTRIYPEINWSVENMSTGKSFEIGAYYSSEYDYHSLGLNAGYSWKNLNNGEYHVKLTGYYDRVKLIYPSELNTTSVSTVTSASSGGSSGIPSSPRVTLNGSFTFSQVINDRMSGSILADLVFQSGELSLPFHRVYFKNGTDAIELLPSTRVKFPIGFRLNYFLGDQFIIRAYYRFYADSWGILAHTMNIELPVKLNAFFSVSPFYRFYHQSEAKYFAPYEEHSLQDNYYTSNYALSTFNSQSFGMGFRVAFIKSLLGTGIYGLEARYSHYQQTTDLVANVVSLNLKFK
ncbi:MAG TPA: DUF3570 domain-containing protein [Puia sp.]|nr:DUF3570 domain-containing protein [Puia sp.]